jgi:MFS transporter, DHA2 family, multidrug resistance protein
MSARRVTLSHKIRRRLRPRHAAFHPRTESYKWWLLANVMIGTFMAVLDATIVNVGLPKIMASFGVGIDKIEWVITAYMLAMAVMLPASAWLADKYGYKRMYFLGMLAFTIGSFLCGFSPNEDMLIISRIIQGLGAGTLMPIGMAIITHEFPPEQRGVALGFWAISSAASVSFGPLIGGFLVDNFSWNLIFDVNVPVGILGLLVTVIIQQEYKNKNVHSFDMVGFISVSLFLPLILYALSEGTASTNTEGWHSTHILVCFAIAAIALAVFITTELTIDEPLLELRLLLNRNFGISTIMVFIFGIGMFGSTFLLPVYLQNSLGYTALQSGSVFLPVGIIQGIMSPLSGKLADKYNVKVILGVSLFLFAFSFYLNTKLSFLTEHHYIMSVLYLRGFALGMIFTPLSAIALVDMPRSKMAQASSLSNVIRQLGGSFGVAILTTLLSSRVYYHSQTYAQSVEINSPAYKAVTGKMAYYFQHQAGVTPSGAARYSQSAVTAQIGKEAFIQAIDDDFLIAGIITVIGIIPVFWLHEKKIKKDKTKQHDEIALE